MKYHILFAFGLCLSLSGCVSRQNTLVVGGNTPSPALLAALAKAAKNQTFSRTVSENSSLKLNVTLSLNPDCTPTGSDIDVRIITPPAHGKGEIVHENVFPQYPPASLQAACNKKRVPGVVAVYTPDKDYVGNDAMSIEIIGGGGDSTRNFVLTVK